MVSALSAGFLSFAHADEWHDTVSPHFAVHQNRSLGPTGLTLNLEKIHNRLRMDLAMFSPWMEKERINFYLYSNAQSYRAGEFHPPAWSNGLALYERRTIVIYDQPDPQKLNEIIAHEMTHLPCESYWADAHRGPPHWLNEGLALMEETARIGQVERSEWFRAMVYLGPKRMIPINRMVAIV